MLQQIIKNTLVANGGRGSLQRRRRYVYKKNEMEILELKYTVTKIKNSLNSLA